MYGISMKCGPDVSHAYKGHTMLVALITEAHLTKPCNSDESKISDRSIDYYSIHDPQAYPGLTNMYRYRIHHKRNYST